MASFWARRAGLASIGAGLLYILSGFAWALTHGTTGFNLQRSFLGVDHLTWVRVGSLYYPLMWVAVAGLQGMYGTTLSRPARLGLTLLQVSLAMHVLSQLAMKWLIDPLTEYDDALGILGWITYLVATLLFTLGALLAGVSDWEAPMPLQAHLSLLVMGLVLIPSLAAHGLFTSNGLPQQLGMAALSIPFGLLWIWLGLGLAGVGRRSYGKSRVVRDQ